MTKQCRVLDLRAWMTVTSKNPADCCIVLLFSGINFYAYVQSINKQKCNLFAFPVVSVLNPLNSREHHRVWAEAECVAQTHTRSCGEQAFVLCVSA